MRIETEGLLMSLEEFFGADRERIRHAREVLRITELLLRDVPGDPAIAIPAAILHDVGIKPAEEKYGSAAGHLQEMEGPSVARAILSKHGFSPAAIDEICDIVAHHHSPGHIVTDSFKALYDADCIVNLADEAASMSADELDRRVEETFLTPAAKALALHIYRTEESHA
jgi:HD superfamily phosphodiesterase